VGEPGGPWHAHKFDWLAHRLPYVLVLFFWRENYIFTYSYMSFVQCITVLMALFIS